MQFPNRRTQVSLSGQSQGTRSTKGFLAFIPLFETHLEEKHGNTDGYNNDQVALNLVHELVIASLFVKQRNHTTITGIQLYDFNAAHLTYYTRMQV